MKLWSGIGMMLISALFSATAPAADLRLLTNMDFPPYITDTRDDGGILTRTVRAALKEVYLDLKIETDSWASAYKRVEKQRALGTYSWAYPKRPENFYISAPIFVNRWYFYSNRNVLQHIDDLDYVGRKARLCLPHGWSRAPRVNSLLRAGKIELVAAEDLRGCLQWLLDGRVDMIRSTPLMLASAEAIFTREPASAALISRGLYQMEDTVVQQHSAYVLFSRDAAGKRAMEQFNQGLKQLISSGRYEQLIRAAIMPFRYEYRMQVVQALQHAGFMQRH